MADGYPTAALSATGRAVAERAFSEGRIVFVTLFDQQAGARGRFPGFNFQRVLTPQPDAGEAA